MSKHSYKKSHPTSFLALNTFLEPPPHHMLSPSTTRHFMMEGVGCLSIEFEERMTRKRPLERSQVRVEAESGKLIYKVT